MRGLYKMEQTGGAPDVIAVTDDAFIFADCSAESPNRRGLSYNQAETMALEFGIKILPKKFYCAMQKTGKFDWYTWSYLATSDSELETGFALAGCCGGDEETNVRHCHADARTEFKGWRGMLKVPRINAPQALRMNDGGSLAIFRLLSSIRKKIWH
jgi:hypothetical protein